MKEELEDQLQVKEATLMEYLENQRQTLLKDKLAVEEKLQKELESALAKDKKLAEELQLQKQNLEKVYVIRYWLQHEKIYLSGQQRPK